MRHFILRHVRAASAFLALPILLATFAAPLAAATSCPAKPELRTSVDLILPTPSIITDLPRAEIRVISGETGASPLSPGLLLNGLTVYHLETRHRIEVSQFPKQRNCFHPSRLTAAIDVKRLEVYIAKELIRGTCQYGVTMDHEMKHVAVLRDGATRLKQEIEAALLDAAAFQPITAPDINTALKRYSTALNTIIDDIRQSVSQEMLRRNRQLDTPAAYRADDARCR